jgi:hypothetical protein
MVHDDVMRETCAPNELEKVRAVDSLQGSCECAYACGIVELS